MNTVTIVADQLIVTPRGLDRLWSLRRRITVPLAHVRGATVDPEIRRDPKGWRGPGLNAFGKHAGTFHRDGERVFWNTSARGTAVVIQLAQEHFCRLVLSVRDAAAAVDRINAAASAPR